MGVFQKDGMWWIDYYNKGKRYREKVGQNRKLAEKCLAKRQTQIAEHKFFGKRIQPPKFTQYADEYLKWYQENRKSGKRALSSFKYLKAYFQNMRLDSITSETVESYIEERKNQIADKPKNKSRPTNEVCFTSINRELAALKTLFNKAIKECRASENPVVGITFFREEPRQQFLEETDEPKLLEACNDNLRDIVIFALHSGCRLSEITSLTWSNVDMNRGMITIRAAYSKSGESRTVYINSVIRDLLERIKEGKESPIDHVFLNSYGRPHQSHTITQRFRVVVKKAGLKNLRFHDLRHTFASRLAMRGVPILDLSRLLGHKTLQMTMRYAHFTDHHLRSHVDLLTKPVKMPSKGEHGHYLVTRADFEKDVANKDSRKPLN